MSSRLLRKQEYPLALIMINVGEKISYVIASGFGTGFSPVAPGTAGSVAALVVWYALRSLGILQNPLYQLVAVAGVVFLSVFSIRNVLGDLDDPQWIVIDEWAGVFVALAAFASAGVGWVLCAWALFRLFDATKWGLVGRAEHLPGAWGVVTDDLVAGIQAQASAFALMMMWRMG